MKILAVGSILLGVMGVGCISVPAIGDRQATAFEGSVQRVWEDGFRLESGDRTLNVDTWALCGDSTAQALSPGEQVSLSGEFDGRDFDAFEVTKADGTPLCEAGEAAPAAAAPAAAVESLPAEREPAVVSASGTSFAGTVQRVWEDGFLMESGDRTLTVDTWELCGDSTAQSLAVGDSATVTGEFDGGEFDAASLTDSAGRQICN